MYFVKRILLAVSVCGLAIIGRSEPVKVIFDTDMYTDFDDAGALACLHALTAAGAAVALAGCRTSGTEKGN